LNISNQIDSLMRKTGVTRLKLSNDTGIPYTTLTQIINGRTKNPQVKALETIADYFNVSLDYILGNSTSDASESAELTDVNGAADRPITPNWATQKDIRDFKKMLEDDAPVMFDGVPISEEDKEKIKRVMEAMFWDAKKKNKETYGRKTKGD
jgi:transcriptional regulator with XRE-family HTH domain